MKKLLCLTFLFGFLVIAGCATVGRDFASARVPELKIGKTTQSEVMSLFGSPWRTGIEDGKQTWTYGKYHYSLFNEASTKDLVIRFDDRGVITSYSYNTTNTPE
jgi:outer membrane protein assembly factor BamE (lipoprotein component of BamABCDE complex)